jgi:hypothetical protein
VIFFKNAPAGEARNTALVIGALATAFPYTCLCLIPCLPAAGIPVVGSLIWLGVVVVTGACHLFLNWYVFPHAIAEAYQDAYRAGPVSGGADGG